MTARLCIAAISIVGAFAQQSDRTQKPAEQPNEQTEQRAPAAGQVSEKPATPETSSKTASGQIPEMKTKTHKGVLVDASCALPQSTSAGASSPAKTGANPTNAGQADRSAGQVANSTPANESGKNKADVSTDQAACPVSESTNQLALKLDDGRMLSFDLVGNQRAQDAFKTKTKWKEAASAGKPIRVTVSGVTSGEKIIVSSIK